MRYSTLTTKLLCAGSWTVLCLFVGVGSSHAQILNEKELVAALHDGGYVILMRHAASPRALPDATQSDVANPQHERQLDDQGRASARALGDALRALQIPVGQVLSSPTYRALETVYLARLGQAKTYPQLGDGGQNMQVDPTGMRAAWLRSKVAESPNAGTDTIIVTHFPNVNEAYPKDAAGLADGEALVFRPDGHGAASLVGRMRIEQWTQAASRKMHN
jgi:phosphohistidine phosphatase SixA